MHAHLKISLALVIGVDNRAANALCMTVCFKKCNWFPKQEWNSHFVGAIARLHDLKGTLVDFSLKISVVLCKQTQYHMISDKISVPSFRISRIKY